MSKLSKLLGQYRKKIENLKTRNEGLFEMIEENKKPQKYEINTPEWRIKETKGYNVEYNRNAETIRVLEIVIQDLENIIIEGVE